MLQTSYLIDNVSETLTKLEVKNHKDAATKINSIIEIDLKRKAAKQTSDEVKAQSNAFAKKIGEAIKNGLQSEARVMKQEVASLKEEEKKIDEQLQKIEKDLFDILVTIPNLPHTSVPKGTNAEHNITISQHGAIPTFTFNVLAHWDLASKYNLIDFELGVKITGAGFPVYKDKGAKLQRALINYFLDKATANGYKEIQPPILINAQSGFGTGQLPDKENQMYECTIDNLYLIPTAEVPITNIYRDVILNEKELPIKNCGYTPCFRREAGSYGKDVRGLNRLHQFDKVEIVQITSSEKSYQTLEDMLKHVCNLLDELELPYRILKLCGGDMSFASALTYDLEVYSSAQQKWLEVSSVSNFEAFQTNRLKCRYKDANGKTQLTHSLNGSALALPRIVAALLENNQTEKGIKIPKALQSYTGFDIIQ